MPIITTGRIVKIKRQDELKRIGSKNMDQSVLDYNHLRVYFSDGSQRHFLFTDKQIEKALDNDMCKNGCDNKVSWMKEFWYEGVMEFSKDDMNKIIEKHNLPKNAYQYNHLRIDIDGEEKHLVLTHAAVRSSIKRTKKKGDNLPKVSWLSDVFFNTKEIKNGEEQKDSSEAERKKAENKKTIIKAKKEFIL